jgi:hypothetical protein
MRAAPRFRRPTLIVLLAIGFPAYAQAVEAALAAGESIKLSTLRADTLAAFGFAPSSAQFGLLMRDRAGFWHVGDAAWHCLLALSAPVRTTLPVALKANAPTPIPELRRETCDRVELPLAS